MITWGMTPQERDALYDKAYKKYMATPGMSLVCAEEKFGLAINTLGVWSHRHNRPVKTRSQCSQERRLLATPKESKKPAPKPTTAKADGRKMGIEDKRKRAMQLYREGASYDEISKRLKVRRLTVRAMLQSC